MSIKLGWLLAFVCVALATQQYGMQGFAASVTLVVFWLLLHLSRTLRVMRRAGERPVGMVPSAVMLHAGLKTGMPMLNVVAQARSLGTKVSADDSTWRWQDEGGSAVTLYFADGRLQRWTLDRPSDADEAAGLPSAP